MHRIFSAPPKQGIFPHYFFRFFFPLFFFVLFVYWWIGSSYVQKSILLWTMPKQRPQPEAQFPKLCGISPGCWFVDMCSNTQHSRHLRCRIEASLTHSKDAAGAGCSPACSGDGLHPVYAAGFHFQGFSALLQGNGVSVPSPCSWMSCTLMIAAFITTHVCESQTVRGLRSVMPTISEILCNTCPCCFGFLIGCYC